MKNTLKIKQSITLADDPLIALCVGCFLLDGLYKNDVINAESIIPSTNPVIGKLNILPKKINKLPINIPVHTDVK